MKRSTTVYAVESDKSVLGFVKDFQEVVTANDFVIHNSASMDMKKTFTHHGVPVADDFDLHMIQICKPAKSSASLGVNIERAIFMPKFVHVFSKGGATQIRFLLFDSESIADIVPADSSFPESLQQTFSKICSMIDQSR
ncbi:MAG: hypothetical protein V2I36_09960 [Desulfopila sp.]|jgi:hypothetical protein|nr:hypothetical protein [Desulfopila sp.]